MATASHLVRKQFLVSTENVDKLQRIAKQRGGSVTEVVRKAIDAFEPEEAEALEAPELMALLAGQLREALQATEAANRKVDAALEALDRNRETS